MITHVTIHTAPQPTRATGLYALKPWFAGRLTFVVNAAVARQMSPDTFTVAGAGASRRNGGPRGKTERCLFLVLAAAFPILMPFLAVSLVIGSLITAALRLRAAHRELKAQQLRTDVVAIRSDSVAESGYALAEVA